MTPENPNRYRKRADDSDTGLVKQKDPSTSGLNFQKLDEAASGAAPGLTAIADQVLPFVIADTGLGDYGLGRLVAEQANLRVRSLLEKAHGLISEGKGRSALVTIEEALGADPASGEAWALKGRCLAELGLHEAALRVFQHAREKVADAPLRMMILKLEADCVNASTRAIEAEVVQLVEKNQPAEAIALIHDALQRQPSNLVLLHHLANLQWRSGDTEAARRTIREAQMHVGRDSVDLVADLERKIEFGPHLAAVESARLSLRQKDAAAALRHLETAAALQGNDHYEGLRAYAEGKRKMLGGLLGGKGNPQSVTIQQQTMRWVLSEEIHQAEGALRAGNPAGARAALEAAERIEPDCAAVLYKHAGAIAAGDRPAPEELQRAAAMATRSAIDPAYREISVELAGRIRALRSR